MEARPVGDFFNPFRGPLTADDIDFIEANINSLISELFVNQEILKHELEMDLPTKMHWYVGIVEQVENDPQVEISPLFGNRLRALLKMVNEYYHHLN